MGTVSDAWSFEVLLPSFLEKGNASARPTHANASTFEVNSIR